MQIELTIRNQVYEVHLSDLVAGAVIAPLGILGKLLKLVESPREPSLIELAQMSNPDFIQLDEISNALLKLGQFVPNLPSDTTLAEMANCLNAGILMKIAMELLTERISVLQEFHRSFKPSLAPVPLPASPIAEVAEHQPVAVEVSDK